MGGMSELSWEEISAWLACTQRALPVWDIDVIKNMSKSYVSEFNLASDRARKMPYLAPRELETIDRKAVAAGIATGFSSMVKRKKQG